MPKIIENIRQQLLDEARRQIAERGYAKTTVRSVAKKCGVAVGTVYNYFPSKDMLIASYMSEDWRECERGITSCPAGSAEDLLRRVYDSINEFADKHRELFADPDAAAVYFSASAQYHSRLRERVAELILPAVSAAGDNAAAAVDADDADTAGSAAEDASGDERAFTARFIAEAMLSWTMARESFERIYSVVSRLL